MSADQEYGAVRKLGRISVLMGVKLYNVSTQVAREFRRAWLLVACRRNDDPIGFVGETVGLDAKAALSLMQPRYAAVQPHRQINRLA